MKRIFQCLVLVALLLPIIFLPNQAQEIEQKSESPKKLKLPTPKGPSQYILIKASLKNESATEFEKFCQEEILPIIANSKEVKSLRVFSSENGKNPTYIVLLEMKKDVILSSNTAVRILSTGKTPQEASAILKRFSRFFDSVSISTEQVALRPDLSISPGIAGTIRQSKK